MGRTQTQLAVGGAKRRNLRQVQVAGGRPGARPCGAASFPYPLGDNFGTRSSRRAGPAGAKLGAAEFAERRREADDGGQGRITAPHAAFPPFISSTESPG